MIRLAVLAAVVLLVVSACGWSRARHGGSGVVTAGRVGSLRIDVSTRAVIQGFAGNPDRKVVGRTQWPGVPKYLALAYDCARGPHGAALRGLQSCLTVYYLNSRTHRLAAFRTESADFRTAKGISPGMEQNAADRLQHQTPYGPWVSIGESSSIGYLVLPSSCGRVVRGRCNGLVQALMVESRHHPIGLLFT